MWYLKQTATSVWNASKTFIDKRSPPEKLIDILAESQEEILPTNKLNQLAAMTYDMENFDLIVQSLTQRLRVFHYDLIKSQQTYNTLVTTNYLIKHGATGFVDEFREYIGVFKKYQSLKEIKTYDDDLLQKKLDYNLQRIKSRSNHIQILLQDKNKLLKEKELSMLVKQKLKLYEKDKISQMSSSASNNKGTGEVNVPEISEDFASKLEGVMEKYLWKYVDKLDENIESASEKIMQQVDKYVNGEEHKPFQVESDDEENQGYNSEKIQQKIEKEKTTNLLDEGDDQLMKKLQEESQQNSKTSVNSNLLQFEQVLQKQTKQNKEIGQHDELI